MNPYLILLGILVICCAAGGLEVLALGRRFKTYGQRDAYLDCAVFGSALLGIAALAVFCAYFIAAIE